MNGVKNFIVTIVGLAGLIAFAAKPYVTYASEIAQAQKTVEKDRLTFNLQNCLRSVSTVTCNLLVKNTSDRDVNFRITDPYYNTSSSYSAVIDLSGNEYKVIGTQAGQNQDNDRNGYGASVNLIRDVPTKISVKFEVPVEVNALKVLSVVYVGGNVQFRDITIITPKR